MMEKLLDVPELLFWLSIYKVDLFPKWFIRLIIMLNEILKKYLNIVNKLIYINNIYMSDQETNLSQSKKTTKTPKFKKNGEPDPRSVKSSANMSKARSHVKEFLKAGKQIVQQSDSEESSDEIIDLVVRKKTSKHTYGTRGTSANHKQYVFRHGTRSRGR